MERKKPKDWEAFKTILDQIFFFSDMVFDHNIKTKWDHLAQQEHEPNMK